MVKAHVDDLFFHMGFPYSAFFQYIIVTVLQS